MKVYKEGYLTSLKYKTFKDVVKVKTLQNDEMKNINDMIKKFNPGDGYVINSQPTVEKLEDGNTVTFSYSKKNMIIRRPKY